MLDTKRKKGHSMTHRDRARCATEPRATHKDHHALHWAWKRSCGSRARSHSARATRTRETERRAGMDGERLLHADWSLSRRAATKTTRTAPTLRECAATWEACASERPSAHKRRRGIVLSFLRWLLRADGASWFVSSALQLTT